MAAVRLLNVQGTPRRCLHAKVIYLSSKPFWGEGVILNADDIDAYPGAPGRSRRSLRTSRRQMVLTVGERPRATVRERRRYGGSTGRGSRRSELVLLMERGSRDHHVLCKCCDSKTDGTGRIAAWRNPR